MKTFGTTCTAGEEDTYFLSLDFLREYPCFCEVSLGEILWLGFGNGEVRA